MSRCCVGLWLPGARCLGCPWPATAQQAGTIPTPHQEQGTGGTRAAPSPSLEMETGTDLQVGVGIPSQVTTGWLLPLCPGPASEPGLEAAPRVRGWAWQWPPLNMAGASASAYWVSAGLSPATEALRSGRPCKDMHVAQRAGTV